MLWQLMESARLENNVSVPWVKTHIHPALMQPSTAKTGEW